MKFQKIGVFTLLVSVLFTGFLYSDDDASKKEKNVVERGWRFGDIDEVNRTKAKRTLEEILEEMLYVQKKQLKTQDEILALLKEELDPTPKEITLEDGTKCIANSSAECFSMPLTAVAKRIPVFKNWITKPSKEHAKDMLRWQAKYFQAIFDSSTTLGLATAAWGKEAYPLNYRTAGTGDVSGFDGVIMNKAYKGVLNSMSKEIEFYLFLGKNQNLDAFSVDTYLSFFGGMNNIKKHIIFADEESKKDFEQKAKSLRNFKVLLDFTSSVKVDSKLFEKQNIYTTPIFAVDLKKKDIMENLFVGKMNSDSVVRKVWNLLLLKKMVKPAMLTDYDQWKDFSDQEIEKYYDKNYNTTFKEKNKK